MCMCVHTRVKEWTGREAGAKTQCSCCLRDAVAPVVSRSGLAAGSGDVRSESPVTVTGMGTDFDLFDLT